MAKEYFIGVDSGTQSIRAVLFDIKGKNIFQSKYNISTISPRNGWAEQDAGIWWSTLCKALKDVAAFTGYSGIAGIGIAYQRETFVMIDSSGNPVCPAILWNDQRATRQINDIEQELGHDAFHRITGKFLDTTPSTVKIKWIADNEPDNYKKLHKLLDVGAYLHWKLTGRMASPQAGADTLGILDITDFHWSDDILKLLKLKADNMPEIVPSGTRVGYLTKDAAKLTDLPLGLPVVACGGDGQVSSVGSCSLDRKNMALSLGTSIVWGLHSSQLSLSPYYRTMAGCLPGSYYYESVLRAGSSTIKWFINSMVDNEPVSNRLKQKSPESILERASEAIKPGCDGLLTVPYWKGGMMPFDDPSSRGMTIGWSDYHTKAHFYRSILEGIAFELRLVLEGYKSTLNIYPKIFRAGGGGASSKLWCQIISDVTGVNVSVSNDVESTALGAAMLTAWGLGYFRNLEDASKAMYSEGINYTVNPENHETYSNLYNSFYKKLYPLMRDCLNDIGRFALQQ